MVRELRERGSEERRAERAANNARVASGWAARGRCPAVRGCEFSCFLRRAQILALQVGWLAGWLAR